MPEISTLAGVPAPPEFVHAVRRSLVQASDRVAARYLSYHGNLLDDRNFRTWVRAKRQLMDLVGGVRDKVVVDVGAGFGLVSDLLASWGARRVWALELLQEWASSHASRDAAHFGYLGDRVMHVCGDASRLPLRSGTADIVLSIEAISHYYDVDAFLDECARVLKPGGHVLVSDGNNGANPGLREHTVALWQRFEQGPEGQIGEHEVRDPMVNRRERIVRAEFPQLPEAKASELARLTSGMNRGQIVRAVSAHLAGAPAPTSAYQRGQCPREPKFGYLLEQLFDGRDLATRLARRGFEARALPHFGGAANDIVHAANLVLRALPTHRWARAYRVVARKR